MKNVYEKMDNGVEYIIYDDFKYVRKVDLILEYPDGGAILVTKDSNSVDCQDYCVIAHMKYMKPHSITDYIIMFRSIPELANYTHEVVHTIRPVYKKNISASNPQIMPLKEFYEDVQGKIKDEHNNANGKYGCRIIESIIREKAMKEYLRLKKSGESGSERVLMLKKEAEDIKTKKEFSA